MRVKNKKSVLYQRADHADCLLFVLVSRHFTQKSFQNEIDRYGELIRTSYDLVVDDVYANLLSLVTFISSDKDILRLV